MTGKERFANAHVSSHRVCLGCITDYGQVF